MESIKDLNHPLSFANTPGQQEKLDQFQKGLHDGINKLSLENGSNTPDFILAEFLRNVLAVWNKSVMKRSEWYGGRDSILWKDSNQRKLDLSKDFVHAIEQSQDVLAEFILPQSKFTKTYVINTLFGILDNNNLVAKLREYNGVKNMAGTIKKDFQSGAWQSDPGAKVYVTRKGMEAMINTGRCGPAEKVTRFYKSGDRFLHLKSAKPFKLVTLCRGTEQQSGFLANEKTGRGYTGRLTPIKDTNRITEEELAQMRLGVNGEENCNSEVHEFELINDNLQHEQSR